MKKQLVTLLALPIAFAAAVGLSETKDAKAEENLFATAEYVSTDFVPTIDGEMDDVWLDTDPIYISNINGDKNDNPIDAPTASVRILWNETGLYFLAEIEDGSVVDSDMCNFWVSETYYSRQNDNMYPFVDGAYYICLTPQNQLYVYDAAYDGYSRNMAGAYTSATIDMGIGYAIEMYVPKYGDDTTFRNGGSIGFNISIDDYVENCTVGDLNYRQSYTNWGATGSYWKYPSALGEVMLVDDWDANGTAPVYTPSTPSNSASSSASSSTTSSVTESSSQSEEDSSSGCGASVAFAPLAVALIAGVALFKKKNS